MPLTPFHFGPGLLIKSLSRRHFSLSAFIISQIVMDMETLWNILRGAARLHVFFHTFLGSLVPALITIWLFRSAANRRAVVFASLIGVWSHVLLDAIMHRDMMPFAPFSAANPWLGMISVSTLHVSCVLVGIAGWFLWRGIHD